MSARDLKLTFTANGRNVEFYSADRYIETMRGVKGDNGKFTYEVGCLLSVIPCFSYPNLSLAPFLQLHVPKPKVRMGIIVTFTCQP